MSSSATALAAQIDAVTRMERFLSARNFLEYSRVLLPTSRLFVSNGGAGAGEPKGRWRKPRSPGVFAGSPSGISSNYMWLAVRSTPDR